MVKKVASAPEMEKPAVTVERAARLHRMLKLLGSGTQTRSTLARRLKLDVRGFYRDLELLRTIGISVHADDRYYHLLGPVQEAVNMLPLPDPHLTIGEAMPLTKGSGRAHKKLREHLSRILNPKPSSRK